MTIIDSIKTRKSIRSYSGEALSSKHKELILKYIKNLPQAFDGNARIELVSRNSGIEPVKLGTYGVISGATDFLVLIHDNAKFTGENAGYLFEQVVLQCTTMGLGTCWIGGTFKSEDFASQIVLNTNDTLRIISPIGYPAQKIKLLDRIMKVGAGSSKRKEFESLFFADDIGKALDENHIYFQPLEMVRLAPSARNLQPWRAIVCENNVHFYYVETSRFNDLDMGIALCHFRETCIEMGLKGRFSKASENMEKEDLRYCISWLSE